MHYMYVPAVVVVRVITSLTLMGMGGNGAVVVVADEVDVELETSGLVRQKMLETKACIIELGRAAGRVGGTCCGCLEVGGGRGIS